ncbi:hypothetical protein Hanom_Chr17g01541631 [Helianthus anomalus]
MSKTVPQNLSPGHKTIHDFVTIRIRSHGSTLLQISNKSRLVLIHVPTLLPCNLGSLSK